MNHVLVVDDMPENLRLVRRVLAPAGFSISEALDGKDALALASQTMPDLVLVDLRLGEDSMTGYELARKLRGLPGGKKVVLVALSGGAVLDDDATSSEAGFDGFIAKPFDVKRLPETLRLFLAGKAPDGKA